MQFFFVRMKHRNIGLLVHRLLAGLGSLAVSGGMSAKAEETYENRVASPIKTVNPHHEQKQSKPIIDRNWYRQDDTIVMAGNDAETRSGSILILANQNDITQLGNIQKNGQLAYSVKRIGLKQGLNTIEIYTGSPTDGWRLLESYQVGILNDYGFERSQLQPSLSLDTAAQPYFRSSGSTLPPPDPQEFVDLDYKTGFNLETERAGWIFSANQDWVGTSRVTKALRFSQLGDEAPLFDLSGYNFTLKSASTKIEVGNNGGIGANPLLVERIANRGITITQGIGSIASVALTAQSGRLITGYDDFLGIGQDFNSLYGAELALYPFAKKEHLGIGLSFLSSEQPAQADFGFGQVPVAESSQG